MLRARCLATGICGSRFRCSRVFKKGQILYESRLREKDCQLTFSEIVSPKSVEGQRLESNIATGDAGEFGRARWSGSPSP
jgi:hypothetical protein